MSDERVPRRRHWIGVTIVLLVTGTLIALGWVVVRGLGAINELNRLGDETTAFKKAISESELERLQPISERMVQHAASAHELTSDPVWRAFELVPWFGTNMTAFREVSALTSDAARNAIQPLVASAKVLDLGDLGLSSPVDLVAFEKARAPLRVAADVLSDASAKADRLTTEAAPAALASAVHSTQEALHQASRTVGALRGASALLPMMLGTEAPRQYLVAVHDATVDAVGAISLVHVQNGETKVVRTVPATDFSEFAALVNSDDFSEAAAPLATAWQQRFGEAIDGVFALDTVAAGHLLEATGALTIGEYTIDSDNVVDALQSSDYLELADPAQHQQLFTATAEALLISALAAPPRDIVAALAESGDEQHAGAWSAHEKEESVLAASTLNTTSEKSP